MVHRFDGDVELESLVVTLAVMIKLFAIVSGLDGRRRGRANALTES